MEATLRLAQRASYVHYLATEQNSDSRHEFIDGVIVAMAGGSSEHNAIAANVKVYRRTGGEWSVATYRDGERFEPPTLSSPVAVDDIYNRVLDGAGRSLLRK